MDFSLLTKQELMSWIEYYQDRLARKEADIEYLVAKRNELAGLAVDLFQNAKRP